ncbi:DNA methylase [Betaproteobacteria bacterium UKL13-2]|nr:DNA methylase [Betaproteobacteria bacterium UKL13-2]HCG53683.1 site-specific DNA-methyltransferase [Betaproteobacteria bacterium]
MPRVPKQKAAKAADLGPVDYRHGDKALARPDVGTQSQFRQKKVPATYHYDSSISPALDWDSQNSSREKGEVLIAALEAQISGLKALLLPAPQAVAVAKGKKATITPAIAASGHASPNIADIEAKLIAAQDSLSKLKALSKPFLNWSGKAERLSFDVPTLPLFVHERLSTKAILETLKGHRKEKQLDMFDLFADAERPVHEQVLKAYQYQDDWVNRMILGDSLVVMNSLINYEGMRGKVQMIYFDPPYGVKFGSNFQPFVRKRDVSHNDDEDMTREPEMVQAYRDTWELGLHSYLTYLRDRLLLARELLTTSGSIFVQISDENLHHVREVMDEVFGAENFCAVINFKTMMPLESGDIESVVDYLVWYSRDKENLKYRNLYVPKSVGEGSEFVFADTPDGGYRRLSSAEVKDFAVTASNEAIFKRSDLTSSGYTQSCIFPISFDGRVFETARGKSWRTTPAGVAKLAEENRLFVLGNRIYYKMYLRDFGYKSMTNQWDDTIEFGSRLYVVQTTSTVIQRCMLMTTDPGDLVLDPTCGSGTTAYVAEQWGRRWLTIDTSRVPLALARQRLLTATYPWYELKDDAAGPGGGFVYKRKQNNKGEEVGGIVPHITLKSIANNEPPAEEVLVDRPEPVRGVTRISGPFAFEATIPNVVELESGSQTQSGAGVSSQNVSKTPADAGVSENRAEPASFVDRLLEILRKSPVVRVGGNKTVTFKNLRRPAKTLSLSAEGLVVNGEDKPVAFVFGPENGAVVEKLVFEAAKEAFAKSYTHLYVVGFAIQPNARSLIETCNEVVGIAATYVQATPDLLMGDLLKNMRSSQIFSVCGMPEIALRKVEAPKTEEAIRANVSKAKASERDEQWYAVELIGLDVFDPVTMEVDHRSGKQVPAWFLDTDYNGLSFHVTQAFFPETKAWENLKRALGADYESDVWSHLAGTVSVPFVAGEHKEIAVKVIDHRGNELMVVAKLEDALLEDTK